MTRATSVAQVRYKVDMRKPIRRWVIVIGGLITLAAWTVFVRLNEPGARQEPVRASATSDSPALAPPVASSPIAATTRAVRDPGMRVRFVALGLMRRADGSGLASIAIDDEPPRLFSLNDELRPGIFLRQIAPNRVRIASLDGRTVWDLSVMPPPDGSAVPSVDTAGRVAGPAGQPMQAAAQPTPLFPAGGTVAGETSQIQMQQQAALQAPPSAQVEGVAKTQTQLDAQGTAAGRSAP